MALAFATGWMGPGAFGADRLLAVMQGLNLRDAVLSARGNPARAAAAATALRAAGARFVAVEAADMVDGEPGSLCSSSAGERVIARRAVAAAVSLARDLGAPDVVLRLGAIDVERARERDDEIRAARRTGASQAELDEQVQAVRRDLELHQEPYLERACRELFDICRRDDDLRFAIATPTSVFGVPTKDALAEVFSETGARNLGYWHDACAARRLERLGLAPVASWSGDHADRTHGAWLADATDTDAQLPPGAGDVDFRQLRDLLPSTVPCAVDVDDRFALPELEMGVGFLRSLGF